MVVRDRIQIDLVKLTSGERLIRLTEAESGLSLEKTLDERRPIVAQKKRLLAAFEAALARAELTPA